LAGNASIKAIAWSKSCAVCLFAANWAQYMRIDAEAVGQNIAGQFGTAGNFNSSATAINPTPPVNSTIKSAENCQVLGMFRLPFLEGFVVEGGGDAAPPAANS
jgi:hypothetical protein